MQIMPQLQLKGTRFSNGLAFLEPSTVKLIGGFSADLEAKQNDLFKQSLRERLGSVYALSILQQALLA